MRQYILSIMMMTLIILPVQAALLAPDESKNYQEDFAENNHSYHPWSMMVPSTTPLSEFDLDFQSQSNNHLGAQDSILDIGVVQPSRLMIVSVNDFSLHVLDALQPNFPHTIIDHLDEQTVIIRFDHVSDVSSIVDFEFVEFASYLPHEYKISPLIQTGQSNLMVTVAPPFSTEQHAEFTSLSIFDNAEINCYTHSCLVSGPVDFIALAKNDWVLFIEPAYHVETSNSDALNQSGVTDFLEDSGLALDGSGETIMFVDTGIDINHPDLGNRVTAVSKFGLDSNPSDEHSSHGTHIGVTIAGDGTIDQDQAGMAPEAQLIAYAMEHNPTGVFGRIGSLYDIYFDAMSDYNARLGVNAWTINASHGMYTADSRMVDLYVKDHPTFLPIFAVGNENNGSSSSILPPSTSKNGLSIGAVTYASSSPEVASFSGQGPTLDGRIKPDLVAPGVNICSGQAEESLTPFGSSCGSDTHANGASMYMEMSGTSQATAVAGGASALVREYLREDQGISGPTSALIKAVLINGAQDLGTPDIPNSNEGWGKIDLKQSLNPSHAGIDLDMAVDNNRIIQPGFSSVYAYDIDVSKGLDITLVWTDAAGSSGTPQSESRLISNLDLELIDPNGVVYHGNQFANGFSIAGGTSDSLNNVERIKLPSDTSSVSGTWQVKIIHRGGVSVTYGLAMSGSFSQSFVPDLMTLSNSIFLNPASPLVNEPAPIQLSWYNQGAASTGNYKVTLTDETVGETLMTAEMSPLASLSIGSKVHSHSFTQIGVHTLRLTLDSNQQVTELNDESNGVNNNFIEFDIMIAATGLRLYSLNDSLGVDESSKTKILDVQNSTSVSFDLALNHEGTGNQSVSLYISNVQELVDPVLGRIENSKDIWTREKNISNAIILTTVDTNGSNLSFQVTFDDISANLQPVGNDFKRYARSGTYIVDIQASYDSNNQVTHSMRLVIIVPQVRDVIVVPSGNAGLLAAPGSFAPFYISLKNIGNVDATYAIECQSDKKWQVELGDSNSSVYNFETFDLLDEDDLQVRTYVPPAVDGLPSAGTTDFVSCWVTSSEDSSLNVSIDPVDIEVLALNRYSANLIDESGELIDVISGNRIYTNNGEWVNLTLELTNLGNTALSLSVSLQKQLDSWPVQMQYDDQISGQIIQVNLLAGGSANILITVVVYDGALAGDVNQILMKTTGNSVSQSVNSAILTIDDSVGLSLSDIDDALLCKADGNWHEYTFTVKNEGNILLSLDWSHSLLDDGWEFGFFESPKMLEPKEEGRVIVAVKSPNQTASKISAQNILISVNGSVDQRYTDASGSIQVDVLDTFHAGIIAENNLMSIERGIVTQSLFSVTNEGNIPLNAQFSIAFFNRDGVQIDTWTGLIKPDEISNLPVGNSQNLEVLITPGDEAEIGIVTVLITAITSDGNYSASFETSVEVTTIQGGLFGALPSWAAYSTLFGMILVGLLIGLRVKRGAKIMDDGDALVAPDVEASAAHLSRREDALDVSYQVNDLASGAVSEEEMQLALAQSLTPLSPPPLPGGRPPALFQNPGLGAVPAGRPPIPVPTTPPPVVQQQQISPPLPPGGLPPGWTLEQWQHYGAEWLRRNG